MMFGRMCHRTALVVAPAGISERTTNQPFCARLRASYNDRGAESETIFTRVSGSSGDKVIDRPPLASGNGSPDASFVIGPSGSRGKRPGAESIAYALPK